MAPELPFDLERELYAAALDLRRAEPWKLIANTHYLLIAEPDGGRRAVVVLGNGGQQYGVQSYAASCAAQWLVLVEELSRVNLASPTIIYELLEGQEVEFTSKKELDGPDIARAMRCGHQPPPRSRHAWPRFRAFRLNRFPWHVDESAARILLGDLRRATRWAELASRLQWPDLDQPVALRKLPVVAAELPTDRPWSHADLAWERLTMPPVPKVPRVVFDPASAAAWQTCPVDPELEVFVDERAPLIRIGDGGAGGAPRFPRLGLCLDNRTGMILGHQMGTSDDAFGSSTLRTLKIVLATLGRRPAVVTFVNPNLQQALEPWLNAAGLPGKLVKPSRQLEEIWSLLS